MDLGSVRRYFNGSYRGIFPRKVPELYNLERDEDIERIAARARNLKPRKTLPILLSPVPDQLGGARLTLKLGQALGRRVYVAIPDATINPCQAYISFLD
jgi:hypothetical protein